MVGWVGWWVRRWVGGRVCWKSQEQKSCKNRNDDYFGNTPPSARGGNAAYKNKNLTSAHPLRHDINVNYTCNSSSPFAEDGNADYADRPNPTSPHPTFGSRTETPTPTTKPRPQHDMETSVTCKQKKAIPLHPTLGTRTETQIIH